MTVGHGVCAALPPEGTTVSTHFVSRRGLRLVILWGLPLGRRVVFSGVVANCHHLERIRCDKLPLQEMALAAHLATHLVAPLSPGGHSEVWSARRSARLPSKAMERLASQEHVNYRFHFSFGWNV